MFVISQASSTLATALQSFQELLLSEWFYYALGLIALDAAIARLLASLIRSRVDVVELGMGWPGPMRLLLRVFIANIGVAIFALLAWSTRIAMTEMTWPSRSYPIAVAASLATAWLVISLVTTMIRNPLVVRVVSVVAWIAAALSILGLLRPAISTLDSFALVFGNLRISPWLLIKVTIFLGLSLWIARVVSTFLEARVAAVSDLTPSVQVLITKLVRISLMMLAVIIALSAVGVDLSAFAIFSGAVGVGIGFGLQKIIANFISGVILLADKSVKPGDIVTVGDSFGRISAMNTRYISVAAVDGREFLIPNEDLVTQKVINWTYSDKNTLLSVKFGVSYHEDPRKVMALAIAAASSVKRVSAQKPPSCQFAEFGEWALNFQLSFWIDDPERGLANVRSDVLLAILETFRKENVDLPYLERGARSRPAETPAPTA